MACEDVYPEYEYGEDEAEAVRVDGEEPARGDDAEEDLEWGE